MSGRRQRAEAFGRLAERFAMLMLILQGYRILDHRARTAAGEIDLVARRGEVLAFIEVKARPSVDQARQALRLEAISSEWAGRYACCGSSAQLMQRHSCNAPTCLEYAFSMQARSAARSARAPG